MMDYEVIKAEIGLLELKPKDILIINFKKAMNREERAAFKVHVKTIIPKNKVLILERDAEMSIIRPTFIKPEESNA